MGMNGSKGILAMCSIGGDAPTEAFALGSFIDSGPNRVVAISFRFIHAVVDLMAGSLDPV